MINTTQANLMAIRPIREDIKPEPHVRLLPVDVQVSSPHNECTAVPKGLIKLICIINTESAPAIDISIVEHAFSLPRLEIGSWNKHQCEERGVQSLIVCTPLRALKGGGGNCTCQRTKLLHTACTHT
ncbi:hypothetical protein CDAR_570711 [Caerostris darwini]|uniref:Uncharacterized protein n=1 Tax=Caerostris darwini TaxID=1538125 RepID=A0AAV4QC13_9ARAC|nr:hypothetical protein CDAR_570711 [Caerostris darwini]